MDGRKARVMAIPPCARFRASRHALTPIGETRHGDACPLGIGPAGETARLTLSDMAPPIYGLLVFVIRALPLSQRIRKIPEALPG